MDELVSAVAKAIGKGMSVDKIHDALITKGWPEDTIFLAIKGGQLLAKTIKEAESNKKPPAFRRVT